MYIKLVRILSRIFLQRASNELALEYLNSRVFLGNPFYILYSSVWGEWQLALFHILHTPLQTKFYALKWHFVLTEAQSVAYSSEIFFESGIKHLCLEYLGRKVCLSEKAMEEQDSYRN